MTRSLCIRLALSLGLALPLMSTTGFAMGSKTSLKNQTVALTCKGLGNAALHADLCAELLSVMSETYPTCQFTQTPADGSALDVTLNVTKVSATAITAKLDWTGAARGNSDPLTVGVRDISLGHPQYEMLVKSLLNTTELPLSSC